MFEPTIRRLLSAAAVFAHGVAEVRGIVFAELRSLEPLCTVPDVEGAFYCFLRVNADVDPMRTAERLIREHRVAIVPGPAFGATDGCHFRVA